MLEELLLHQFVLETDLVYLLLLAQFDLKMVNLSFQILNLYQQEILVGVIPYTNGGTVGYCSPSHPFLCEHWGWSSWSNSSVVYWTNAVVGVEGILTFPSTWSLFKIDQGKFSLDFEPHLFVMNSSLISS